MPVRDLNAREGKVLRFVVSNDNVVRPSMCVVRSRGAITDLPRSPFVARAVLERLRAWGFVTRTDMGYVSTQKGRTRLRQADGKGEWRAPGPHAYGGTSRPA